MDWPLPPYAECSVITSDPETNTAIARNSTANPKYLPLVMSFAPATSQNQYQICIKFVDRQMNDG
jgi:hypothetical protein